ncbi:2-succinyl-6-hydroxy-2,4-cyclohexadiene-1- carboxylic acid synthase/2-oxoglutarate decarboxylase [Beutenbergia cavernae DSM 12333]|uniref:2-succinyl-5-enolpyruvyl-6-hydroxy-3-cyclohexene-1-carboxylate synthase n=1 Tax=Beutenbergia cavernae (strain ATCC BAA-8 / DSM 12333 / CCUG 43141 / JCM 11478 / NBRC 16432 / NCIMB 13614 / HKI 0122) TaxID=471853 RepID=C5C0T3_BEUC1|nr:2-succinyl-5-enolpyruvyl-6-hydroxy-3-cyclohexene-1-carboxylic-acid synthase [Beutenbergia cavernae]ACQ81479.1 2-succinyl-6-hydroxy-2,4-cyclohexadiene-1- carboxylic acid synthase/2-oxoglutarate decarboxylase [Beutenbergia cavernae DSM 12333]
MSAPAGGENASTRTARELVEALVEHGVRHAVLAPGSRSAPLAYALLVAERAGRLALHVRIDERSAGFVALGIAKASGKPAVVVTTSGTAVANLHPAVLEAGHARVPLLVLSADRPLELRGTGANQTTDQVDLFGVGTDVSRPRWSVDMPAPGGSEPAEPGEPGHEPDVRDVVARAVAAARGVPGAASARELDGVPGAVHVNVAFREPLVPDLPLAGGERPAPVPTEPSASVPVSADASASAHFSARAVPGAGSGTIVIAGDAAGPAARRLAEAAGLPLLAEPSSGARGGPNAVVSPAQLLGVPGLGDAVRRVVVLGRPTLSRPVSRLLGRADVEVVVADPAGMPWLAPPRALHVPADALALEPGDPAWLARWGAASDAAGLVLDDVAARAALTGPGVARLVAAAAARSGDVLLAGSSMAVRHLDTAAAPSDAQILANRGLAGIDGTVSTAVGLAIATRPGTTVRALLGDLTLLHDAGGLARGPLEREVAVQLVVLHDDGGAIFATLEQGEQRLAGEFERVFGTPQGVDLAALAAAYGVEHVRVEDRRALESALRAPAPGRSLVEVPVARDQVRADVQELDARIVAAATAALSRSGRAPQP